MNANETLKFIETVKRNAINNPDKVYKVVAGYYYVSINDTLWTIDHNTELDGDNWIARDETDMSYGTYTDPYATKRELLEALRG